MVGLWAYTRGVRAIWFRAGRNRGIRYWQVAAGIGGFLVLAIALISPLDPLGSALFSAHMAQHMLLVVVAAPLLILGNVTLPVIWSLPGNWRRKTSGFWHRAGWVTPIWSTVARPLPVLIIHGLVLWAWHVPALYNAAIRSELVHVLEHSTLFGTALLFWWLVIQRGRQAGLNYGMGLLMVFGMVIQKTALGALITFSPSLLYTEHATTTADWGLTPVEDQQLAGAIMMGPGGFVYLIAGVTIFAWWIRAIGHSVDRDERIASGHLATGHEPEGRAKETV
jgi:putative membrane protein